MADNIPSLSEIANVSSDPGRSGIAPEPVIDNTRAVEQLNQQARFHAEQQYRKYNQFLQNKKELFQNISDIQGLETLPEDKEYLHKQAGDILGEILKNPSVIAGGKGFGEIQAKMAKFKSDAMASKASYLDDKTNKMFLDRNPDLYTDENIQAMEANKKLPVNQRKSVMLKMPTLLDEKTLFETALKNATHSYDSVVGKDGKPGEGYIETGLEVNPKALSEQWKLALEGQKDKYGHSILSAVKNNFNQLPDDEKKKYEDMGGDPVENYFKERGEKYLNAYLPEGSYDATESGNFRFGKSLKPDPNYLNAQKLAEETRYHNAEIGLRRDQIGVDYARLGVERDKLKGVKDEDQQGGLTVISNAASVLNNAQPIQVADKKGNKKDLLRISDPTLLEEFGKVSKDGKLMEVPDAINYDPKTDQPILLYFSKKDKRAGRTENVTYDKEIPLDKRTWLNVITRKEFPNKDIGGINKSINSILGANENSLYGISQKLKNPPPEQPAPTGQSKGKVNDANYYNDEKNVVSQKGDKFTYKDGTTWQYKNGKFIKIK